MSITKTPQIATFPYRAVDQETAPDRYSPLPTPDSMKKTSLFGIPLKSFLTNEEVTPEAIQNFINQSISEIEHELDLYITPVAFKERQDYSRHQNFWSFGYLKVDHSPILNVQVFS